MNIKNREAENELLRSTKTPEEVYRIALFYKQGDSCAKIYVSTTRGTTPNSATS